MTWWRDPDQFRERWEQAGWNLSALADTNAVGRTTIEKWRSKHGLERPDTVEKFYGTRRDTTLAQPPLVPILDEQLRIEGNAGVSSDWHAPLMRYDVFHRWLDDCADADLSVGICAGDLTNQDALAGHEDKQKGAELDVEMEHLHYAVGTALDVFDTLIVTLGNHDRHAAQKLHVDFDRSIRMLLADLAPEKLARITVTARDSVIVDTERGEWLVCHTRSYSRLPLAYPNKLALRYGMHVAAGHRHHHAQGKAANGKTIAELGGFMDVERMAYAHRYTNDLPVMANGYGLLVDGGMRCPMLWD